MKIIKQLKQWQYWVHLIIINIFLIIALSFTLKYFNLNLEINQYILLSIFLYIVLGIGDVLAHSFMNLIGWKD